MNELKNCPFCGKEPTLYIYKNRGFLSCENIYCQVMPSTVTFIGEDKIFTAWNNRAE